MHEKMPPECNKLSWGRRPLGIRDALFLNAKQEILGEKSGDSNILKIFWEDIST